MSKDTRRAQGTGSIYRKTVARNGKKYDFWEAQITVGTDPGTGKQIRKTFTGKTQKEVREKMQAAAVAVQDGTYFEPSKMTVAEWLDIWLKEYSASWKYRTKEKYESVVRIHIKPALGAVKISKLTAPEIQRFYNELGKTGKTSRQLDKNGKLIGRKSPLSPKSIRLVHGVLSKALNTALRVGYIKSNPAELCTIPKLDKKEISPLTDAQIKEFVKLCDGEDYGRIYKLILFTGLREGEALGLTWDCVDFQRGTLNINKQMQLHQEKGMEAYQLTSPKNGKGRIVAVAPSVLRSLKQYRAKQMQWKLLAQNAWGNSDDLVFTDEIGNHLTKSIVYRTFKTIAASIGRPDLRFHDLRHSYAVAAIRSGDDIKTVQSNLGHATAAFTLDVYGHVTDQMKQDSAARMEKFIEKIAGE